MNIDAMITWLSGLPIGALYAAIAIISAIENVFPPFPADAAVAFGSFLAARGQASPYSTFLVSWSGNLAGAALMYWVGRRYGTGPFVRRLDKWAGAGAEDRLRGMYDRYGLPAFFITRFLPAVRALVPPFAGALKLPVVPVFLAIGIASGIWFAFVTWVAYKAGANWDELYTRILQSGRIAALGATALVLLLAGFIYLRSQKRKRQA